MSISKKKISENLSSKIEITLNLSSNIIDVFIGLIKTNSKEKVIKISQFGSFYYKKSPERTGRNPKTKEPFVITKRKKLSFISSNKVKNILN